MEQAVADCTVVLDVRLPLLEQLRAARRRAAAARLQLDAIRAQIA